MLGAASLAILLFSTPYLHQDVRVSSGIHTKRFNSLSALLSLMPTQLADVDIATISLLCAEGLPGSVTASTRDALATLDLWAERVRAETDRHLYKFRSNPNEFENSEAYFRMLMMATVVYEDFKVRYNPSLISAPEAAGTDQHFFADPANIFLSGLCGSRRLGTCSSMPGLYIALGRRLGYPLKLVATKSHLFIRWESDTERFNLEATGRGMNRYDDAHFRQWPFPVSDEEIAADGYLKSMSPAEEFAAFLSLRGHCLKANGRLAEAITAYSEAARLAPGIRGYRVLLADAQASALAVRPVPAALRAAPDMTRAAPVASGVPPDPNPLLDVR